MPLLELLRRVQRSPWTPLAPHSTTLANGALLSQQVFSKTSKKVGDNADDQEHESVPRLECS